MSLNKSEVEKIAWLARLRTDKQENATFSHELSQILELVEQMNATDTSYIEAIVYPMKMTTNLRPDEVTEANQRTHLQQQAPLTKDGYYLVPKVIE